MDSRRLDCIFVCIVIVEDEKAVKKAVVLAITGVKKPDAIVVEVVIIEGVVEEVVTVVLVSILSII